MPRRAKSRKSSSALNVTGPGQFGQLASLLGKNPVVLVFVYADWCGHCQHFKPDWKKLETTPNRNMPMVSVREDALPKSPLNNLVTPEGYPTVAVVSPANDVSINLPTRDPEVLENIVTNANSLVANAGSASALNTNIENIIENNKPANNQQLLLGPVDNESEVNLKKTHSNVVPVTRDTIKPPMEESDYLRSAERPTLNMKQLGGGLWSMFTGSGASASASASALAAPLSVKVTGGKRRHRKTTKKAHRRR